MIRRINWILLSAAGLTGLATLAAPALGQGEAKKSDDKPASTPARKTTPETKAVDMLGAAFKLVDYGREKKAPEALIVAARVIGTTAYQKGDLKDSQVKEPAEFDAQKVAYELIDEALKMDSAAEADLKKLAEATKREIAERPRGAIPGPVVREGRLGPGDGVDTYTVPFRGNQVAKVRVRNTTRADVDLTIIDLDSGQRVAYDHSADDDCYAEFFPTSTGRYRIVLHNYTPNLVARYVMITN